MYPEMIVPRHFVFCNAGIRSDAGSISIAAMDHFVTVAVVFRQMRAMRRHQAWVISHGVQTNETQEKIDAERAESIKHGDLALIHNGKYGGW